MPLLHNPEKVYALVSFNQDDVFAVEVFTTAKSSDYYKAITELKDWAIAHNHRIATSEVDDDATCVIKVMRVIQ